MKHTQAVISEERKYKLPTCFILYIKNIKIGKYWCIMWMSEITLNINLVAQYHYYCVCCFNISRYIFLWLILANALLAKLTENVTKQKNSIDFICKQEQ
jgi:hypothetical protein